MNVKNFYGPRVKKAVRLIAFLCVIFMSASPLAIAEMKPLDTGISIESLESSIRSIDASTVEPAESIESSTIDKEAVVEMPLLNVVEDETKIEESSNKVEVSEEKGKSEKSEDRSTSETRTPLVLTPNDDPDRVFLPTSRVLEPGDEGVQELSSDVEMMESTGPNLISNPSLEMANAQGDPVDWFKGKWGTNTAIFTYPVAGIDGVKAAKVQLTQYTSGDAKWYFKDVNVISGHTYRFTDKYKSNVLSHITIRYKHSDGSFSYVDLAHPSASGSVWKTSNVQFVVPQGVISVTIFHLINQIGTLTIDDYSLTDESSSIPPQDPDNLVSNAHMEITNSQGLPLDWFKGKWGNNTAVFTYPVAGYQSNSAAKVAVSNYSTGDAKWYFKEVPITGGQNYFFSDHYKSNVTSWVTVQYRHANGSFSWIDLGSKPAASSWTQFDKVFTAPATAVAATVFHLIKTNGELTVDNYFLKHVTDPNQFNLGIVSLNFDDGYWNAYNNALPILENASYKATWYIITNRLGCGFAAYFCTPQVVNLYNLGHEIGNHTKTHADLTQITPAQAMEEIQGAKQALMDIGVGPITTFAYPFGAYNDSVKQMVIDSGHIAARTTNNGFNTPTTDPHLLMRKRIINTTTVDEVKAWIDEAIADQKWLVIAFHQITEDNTQLFNMTPDKFAQVVAYLQEQNAKVLTMDQAINVIQNN